MTHKLETIVSWCKRRGIVYPGSDIYGGLANSWDYGPYGSLLRKNIYDQWWKFFVQEQPNIMGIDGAILMNPKVWEASGHVGGFYDPLIDDKKTGERFRADKIIEDHIEAKRKDHSEDEILAHIKKQYGVDNVVPDSWELTTQHQYIIEENIKNPNSKKDADWTDVRTFSLMLSTKLGVIEDDSAKVWMRPETAQAMFVNFKNVIDTTRARLPFGLAQIGKAFRNEITPGNFLFRTREFEQMEIQMFLRAEDAAHWYKKFEKMSWEFWTQRVGLNKDNLRNRDHASDELAHYASQARDFEYQYPWGWGELQGIHDRGDFDVSAHQEMSGKDMRYSDPYTGERFIPHVVELSMWLSRTVVTTLLDAYDEETYTDQNEREQTRVVARFNKNIAPIKYAILPLIKKDEKQVAIAHDIYKKLAENWMCEYDDGWAIGKRYRRQDEIGTPFCITVDHQTLDDGTVTIRHRDSMEQKRVSQDALASFMQ